MRYDASRGCGAPAVANQDGANDKNPLLHSRDCRADVRGVSATAGAAGSSAGSYDATLANPGCCRAGASAGNDHRYSSTDDGSGSGAQDGAVCGDDVAADEQ